MPLYQAVLFDVDGTLIHSSPGILETMKFTFQAMGKDITGLDLSRYLGPPLRTSFAEHFNNAEDVEKAVSIYRERYHTHGQFRCSLYPNVKKMLTVLKENGILLYTATSKPQEVVIPILQHFQIADLFEYIGGASVDASLDNKTAVMKHVLSRKELQNKKILMIGDRKEDLIGAVNCKLDAVGILYGYGSKKELQEFNPVFYAKDCLSLSEWILNSNL